MEDEHKTPMSFFVAQSAIDDPARQTNSLLGSKNRGKSLARAQNSLIQVSSDKSGVANVLESFLQQGLQIPELCSKILSITAKINHFWTNLLHQGNIKRVMFPNLVFSN
jgi:hypothetical protein